MKFFDDGLAVLQVILYVVLFLLAIVLIVGVSILFAKTVELTFFVKLIDASMAVGV